MNLAYARKCAERLVERLTPHCSRIEIAGSIRRGKAECADIDLVVIPSLHEERDIFGTVVRRVNLAWKAVDEWATAEKWAVRQAGAEIVSFVARDVQVDIFWTEPDRWGTTLLCRTGSKEHNIWLCNRAVAAGGKWHPNTGLWLNHRRISDTEEAIYAALRLDFMPPEKREAHLLPHASLCRPGAGAALANTR